jgi:hypothetical protein
MLAFLAPDLVKAAIDGHLPHARLCDPPIEWARQTNSSDLLTKAGLGFEREHGYPTTRPYSITLW